MLTLAFRLTLLFCALPLFPGVLGMLLPAFIWQPSTGFSGISFQYFSQLLQWPGLSSAIITTLISGLGSTFLAVFACFYLLRSFYRSPKWQRIETSLAPLLAIPHVAFAIGLVYLFAPTGWLFRILAEVGITFPTHFSLVNDPYGIALMLCLALKETPFLLLMSISILSQVNAKHLLKVSATLGYSEKQAWFKVILPNWLAKMRLPIFSIAAFGVSVVDVALIMGPNNPGTFAVMVWQWFNEGDTHFIGLAAAGSLTLLLLTAFVLVLIQGVQWLLLSGFNGWQFAGSKPDNASNKVTEKSLWVFSPWLILPWLMTLVFVFWSFAKRWRFPDLLPKRWSTQYWQQEVSSLVDISLSSLSFAIISAMLALLMTVICLEYRQKYHKGLPTWLLVIPIISPQLSLLFGIQISSYWIGEQGYWQWVCFSHIWFVFPYVYLSLDGVWQAYDRRYDQTARSLGLTGWQTWWRVKFAQLMPNMIVAMAVGCSVSLAQYLPTQILGGGRITTITTEAVALTSGQDRRVSAVYALIQAMLPLMIFFMALMATRHKQILARVKTVMEKP